MKRDVDFLGTNEFDCVVIGGGIQGAGIAREAALQGLKVLLVDRADFASGTSSRSTKLIHGGLRYLEQAKISLVQESLRERKTLMRLAPHLVKPLPFLFPIFRGDRRPLWQIEIGVRLYDFLAGASRIRTVEKQSAAQIRSQMPAIRESGLKGGMLYWDAEMDDARLCLEVLKSAEKLGARVINYMRVVGFRRDADRLAEVVLKDLKTGLEGRVKGKIFINAAGIWVDHVRELADSALPKKIRVSKGIHIATKRLFRGETEGVPLAVARPTRDGRIFFVIPWYDATSLIGTTDTEFTGKPSECYAEKADVEYLLKEFRVAFPNIELKRGDCYTTYTGLRSLVGASQKQTANLSREYEIEELTMGLVSILGGKYTTFRSLSEKVVRRVLKLLAVEPRYEDTSLLSLNGLVQEDEENLKKRADLDRRSSFYGLSKEATNHLWQNYGLESVEIFKLLDYDPSLKESVGKSLFPIKAEVVYAIKDEMVLTVTDFLRRRSRAFFGPANGLDLLDGVAAVYQEYLHWSDEEINRQKDAYRQEVAKNTKALDEASFK